jgi:hypothetical protein
LKYIYHCYYGKSDAAIASIFTLLHKGKNMNFKTSTRFFTLYFFMASVISVAAAPVLEYEIGKWANFCQGAVSHTFDDNTTHQTDSGQALFDVKGFHMTLFTVTGSMNPNWTRLKAAFAKGHEIASHSVTHAGTMPDAECPTSQATIRQNVPGEKCITIAYPNCNIPTSTVNLKKCYIAGRVCDGQVGPKTPADFWKVSCKMAGTAGVNTASGLNQGADQAASSGGWIVWCHHGVANDNHGYSNTPTAVIKGNLDYLDQNRGKFWLETFGNVSRYIYERDAAQITIKSSTSNSFSITVTDNLTDSIFNYPLSIRRTLPNGWTTAVVTQKGAKVEDTIVTVNAQKYIMFKAIPDGGDVVISQTAVAVTRNPTTFGPEGTCPIKLKNKALFIDFSQFNGSSPTLMLFDLAGQVLDRYTFNKGVTRIVVPVDKISQSAFIAKITGNNKTNTRVFVSQ